MVVEERISIFSQGLPTIQKDRPSQIPVTEVLARAREKLGQSYRLLDWNCEHFVCHAFDVIPKSPQLELAVVTIVCLLLARA